MLIEEYWLFLTLFLEYIKMIFIQQEEEKEKNKLRFNCLA